MKNKTNSDIKIATAAVALFGIFGLSASAWTIRPGLLQAKVNGWANWDEASAGVSVFDASVIPVEAVPGPVMADVQATEDNYTAQTYTSPWTGSSFAWNKTYTMWAYKGEIYLIGGTTYTFGKYFDDAARIVIDGTTVLEDATWNVFATGSYTPAATGWYPILVGAYDGTGGKGPSGGSWGAAMGLGWNTSGSVDGDPAVAGWTTLRDPGDGSVFRCVHPSEDVFSVRRVVRTESGYRFHVAVAGYTSGTVSAALCATNAVLAAGADVTDWDAAGSASLSADGTAVIDVAWTGADAPAFAFLGTGLSNGAVSITAGSASYNAGDFAERPLTAAVVTDPDTGDMTGAAITLAASPAGATNTLYAAYGPVDGGDDPADWAVCERVQVIGPDAETVSYTLPDGWGDTVLAVRFFLADGERLPYERQVEYLQSDGHCTIDMGYYLGNTSKVVCRFRYTRASGGNFIGSKDSKYRFFGISWGAFLDLMGDQGNQRIQFGAYDPNTVYHVEFGNHYVYNIDAGSYFATGAYIPLSPDPLDSEMYMMNEQDYGAIYYLAIRENDTDGNTAEYIPVVAWDGTSGLYETVSGTYYPNVGTGAFAAGPTIATSTGTGAWIGSSATIALATPWIENPPTVVRNADGTYTVSATLDSGMGSVSTVYNDIVTNLLAAAATGPAAFSDTPAGLSPDTTYAYATFASGLGVERYVAGTNTFLTGDVFLGATTDADETGLVPGAFTIVRPATAMQHDLVVNYSLAGGTAVAGVNFVDNLTGSVVIPEGSASATIAVTPLLDTATHADTTLTLTLAPGLYGIGAASSASIAIRELSVPEGTNVWIATAAGLASDGANWSAGHAPLASDNVLVDGRYSTFDMEWDAAAGATVASWTQTASYTGTVTFDTLYPDVAEAVFTNFTVTGAAVIDGGVWTHPVSFDRPDNWTVFTAADQRAGRTYRLCVSAQTLTIGAGGAIDVVGKGHSQKNTRGQSCALFCAHGGMIEGASSVGCYGDPKFPEDLGYASNWGTDHVSKDAAGGGAVKLAVAGACVVDGDISADGEISTGHVTAGSAGSILIEAESISGTGSIHADGVFMGNTSYNNGCGGRVALLTADPVDRGTLSVTAAGTTSGRGAANGTVYFHDATMAYGVLRIENAATTRYDTFSVQTTVDGDWTFDAVHLRGSTFFTVPAGTSLTLPNGLASVHSTAAHAGNLGICCNGGDIVLPAGTQTLSGPWTFGTTVPFTFSCPVVLKDGVRLMAYTTLPAQENGDPGRIYNIQGDLSAETGTVIDFRGNQFRVQTAHIAGATVPAGVYLPGDFGSILTDTSESQGGELVVTGGSTVILFQ